MLDPNFWFWFTLISTIGLYKLEVVTALLNLSRLSPTPPPNLQPQHNTDSWQNLRDYVTTHTKLDIIQRSTQLGIFLTFWWAGGFSWLHQFTQSLHPNPLAQGLASILLLITANSLIQLPFEIYDTFGIEARFGFNQTTPTTFITDRIKGALLAFILGTPLLVTLLWLLDNVAYAAIYGWLLLSSFTLLLSFLSPRWLMPLFFKFQPLKDQQLQHAVLDLAKQSNFPVAEVNVVDGSRRSSKANAFFTGMGKTRRIALFDTLINTHPTEEILAVLAHEIGHWHRGHVPKQMILSIFSNALLFTLLHFLLHSQSLSAAFGITPATTAFNLIFFLIIVSPVSEAIGLLSGWLSRKYEFEADAYARDTMQDATPLTNALHRLNHHHLSHPTPHPLHVFLHHSHPPILQRIARLNSTPPGAIQ